MLEAILKYLGMDPDKVKDEKAFTDEFNKSYYNKKAFENQKSPEFRELYPKMIGKFAGASTSKIQSFLKKNGMGNLLEDKEIEGKEFEEVLDMAMEKLHGELNGKIKQLTDDAGKNTDEKIKTLTAEKEQLTKKIESLDDALKTTKTQLEADTKAFAAERGGWKLNAERDKVYSQIKWKDGATELEKKGFMQTIDESLEFAFDEKNAFTVLDKASKKMLPGKKSGEFQAPLEAIEALGVKNNIWAQNPHQTKQTKQSFSAKQVAPNGNLGTFTPPGNPGVGGRVRKVSGAITENPPSNE